MSQALPWPSCPTGAHNCAFAVQVRDAAAVACVEATGNCPDRIAPGTSVEAVERTAFTVLGRVARHSDAGQRLLLSWTLRYKPFVSKCLTSAPR